MAFPEYVPVRQPQIRLVIIVTSLPRVVHYRTNKNNVLDGSNDQLEAIGYKGVTGGFARSLETWVKTSGTDDAPNVLGVDAVNKNGFANQGSGNSCC